jgi:hypothetical protein
MKVALTGGISIIALVALYCVSLLVPQTLKWYTHDFGGFMSVLLISLGVSVVWLTVYRLMDRLKPEPLSMIIYSFATAVIVYVGLAVIVAALLGNPAVCGYRGIADRLSETLRNTVVPAFTLYTVFCLYIVRLDSFDEPVDGLIYGGFVGTGMAFSSGLMDFLGRDSVSFQYLILTVISKSTVYTAIGALTGFLLNRAVMSGKKKYHLYAIVFSATFFEVELLMENLIGRNLLYATMDILKVAVAIGIAVCIFAATIALIIWTLRNSQPSDTVSAQARTNAGVVGIRAVVVFILFAFLCSAALRLKASETRSFSAENGAWSFCLPDGFKEQKKLAETDVLANIAGKEDAVHYLGVPGSAFSGMEIYVDFHAGFRGDYPAADFSPQGDWTIGEKKTLNVRKTGSGDKYAQYQYMYSLDNDKDKIFIDVFSPDNNADVVHSVVRVMTKTIKEGK